MRKRKKKFVVSIHDFGAKGDGFTDDTQAFLAAKRSKADEIKVPEAHYIVSGLGAVVDERFVTSSRKGKGYG